MQLTLFWLKALQNALAPLLQCYQTSRCNNKANWKLSTEELHKNYEQNNTSRRTESSAVDSQLTCFPESLARFILQSNSRISTTSF